MYRRIWGLTIVFCIFIIFIPIICFTSNNNVIVENNYQSNITGIYSVYTSLKVNIILGMISFTGIILLAWLFYERINTL